MRYVYLYFPCWSIEQALQEHKLAQDTYLALTETKANQNIIRICSANCQPLGIRAGISLAQARALCSELNVHEYQAVKDFKLLYKLAVKLLKLSPLLAIDNELIEAYKNKTLNLIDPLYTGVILDIRGTERLYHSEQNLVKQIYQALQPYDITARVAISSTIASAWCFARYANCSEQYGQKFKACIITPGLHPIRRDLDKLPLSGLRISQENLQNLRELGLRNIQSVAQLCPKELARRFGKELPLRLKQFFGQAAEYPLWLKPRTRIYSDREFEPVLYNQEAVKSVLMDQLQEVLAQLKNSNKQSNSFTLCIQGNNPKKSINQAGFCIHRNFELHAASNDEKHILSLLTPLIEKLEIEPGVQRISIGVRTTTKTSNSISNFISSNNFSTDISSANQFVNKLAVEFGSDKVKRLAFHASYLPEKSYRFVSLNQAGSQSGASDVVCERPEVDYPANIFQEPLELQAMALLPDAPPARVILNKQYHIIIKGYGPERISLDWWQKNIKETYQEREYFKVQTETGAWLWIFRTSAEYKWFLHGAWL